MNNILLKVKEKPALLLIPVAVIVALPILNGIFKLSKSIGGILSIPAAIINNILNSGTDIPPKGFFGHDAMIDKLERFFSKYQYDPNNPDDVKLRKAINKATGFEASERKMLFDLWDKYKFSWSTIGGQATNPKSKDNTFLFVSIAISIFLIIKYKK